MRALLVDHEDSFVHNVEQALRTLGAEVRCLRSTTEPGAAIAFDPDVVLLSPGPGHPSDLRLTSLSRALLDRWEEERPFLGICLGHQLIGLREGARVVRAEAPVHGERTPVRHDGRGIFAGIRSPMLGARYHSLVVDRRSVPSHMEIAALGERGVVMSLRHRTRPVSSVQFHPESYLTRTGPHLFRNFLREARR